jgi:hypothetical protein
MRESVQKSSGEKESKGKLMRNQSEIWTRRVAQKPSWRPILPIFLALLACCAGGGSRLFAREGGICGAPANAIVAENCLPDNPSSEWDVSGIGDSTIQGVATDIRVTQGQTAFFKIDTHAFAYTIDIYRMGYCAVICACRVAAIPPTANLAQSQPACFTTSAVGLVDGGNWPVSASWDVPATATLGVYFALLTRIDIKTGSSSHIFFTVRNDASNSDLLYQISDETWQAYNYYGGHCLDEGDNG